MEEMQTLSQEERSRITRRTSVAEDDLDVNGKVQTVLNALQGEDELQKSKVAKVFTRKERAENIKSLPHYCPVMNILEKNIILEKILF